VEVVNFAGSSVRLPPGRYAAQLSNSTTTNGTTNFTDCYSLSFQIANNFIATFCLDKIGDTNRYNIQMRSVQTTKMYPGPELAATERVIGATLNAATTLHKQNRTIVFNASNTVGSITFRKVMRGGNNNTAAGGNNSTGGNSRGSK
jgi:hypothetical protein